jgi:putative transcriptional regulator
MRRASQARAKGTAAKRAARPDREATRKLTPAGAKIVAAFEEAIDAMRPGAAPEPRLTVRTYRVDFTPRAFSRDDVRRVRDLLGMSQVVFAAFLGVDANTVRSWEQGKRPPSTMARRFLSEIEGDPEYWRKRAAQKAVDIGTKEPMG